MSSLSIGVGLTSNAILDGKGVPFPAGFARVYVSGFEAHASIGSASAASNYKISVSGFGVTASLGSASARQELRVSVNGNEATSAVGTVSSGTHLNTTVNATGIGLVSSQGIATVYLGTIPASVNLTGASCSTSLSGVTVTAKKNISTSLTMTGMASSLGSVTVTSRQNTSYQVTGFGLTTSINGVSSGYPQVVANGNINSVTNATSVVPPLPSGNIGDFMIMTASCLASSTSFSGATGWTQMADQQVGANRAAAWYKFRVSGEAAPTVTNSGRVSTNLLSAAITSYNGVTAVRGINSTYSNSAAMQGNDIIVQGRNALAVTAWVRMGANTASTPDALWTEDRDDGTSSGGATRYYMDSQLIDYPSTVPGCIRDGTGVNYMAVSCELKGATADPSQNPNTLGRGMWVRDFPSIVGVLNAEDDLLNVCTTDNITDIYCAMTASLVGSSDASIKAFIAKATLLNVRVWGLDGSRNYFADANGITVLQNNVTSACLMSSGAPVGQKLFGFMIECSPLDSGGYTAFHNGVASSALSTTPGSGVWQNTQALDREYLMRDWAQMHDTLQDICDIYSLKLGTSLPTWFESYQGEPIVCTYNSVTQNAYFHIRSNVYSIALRSYDTDARDVISNVLYEVRNCGSANVSFSVDTVAGHGSGISYADTTGKNNKTSVIADMDTIRARFNKYPGFTFDNINDWSGWKIFSPPNQEPSQPDIRAFNALAYQTRTNTVFSIPTAQNGDHIIIDFVSGRSASVNTVTPHAGFTELGTAANYNSGGFYVRHQLWYKYLTATETSWTFTHSSQSTAGCAIDVVSGKQVANPIESFTSTQGTGLTSTANSVTVQTNHSLLLYFNTNWDSVTGLPAPSGMTTVSDVSLHYSAKQVNMPVGITGVRTQNPNGNEVAFPWSTRLLAIAGQPGGAPPPLTFYGTPVTAGQVGAAYSFQVTASGGTAPYTYSVYSGTLPAGVTINSSTGIVSGTPTTAATYSNIILRVTDAASVTQNLAAFSVTIAAVDNSWPNASNTGPRNTLTASGSITTSSNGQVIQNLKITGKINIQHSNVTVRDCEITATEHGVDCIGDNGRPGLLVEYCRIKTSNGSVKGGTGIYGGGDGQILRYNDISGFENGIIFYGASVTVNDNYIHDLNALPGTDDPHIDGMQSFGGISGTTTIEHNYIVAKDTSCIIMQDEFGMYSGTININNNYLKGNPSVSNIIYLRHKPEWGNPSWGTAVSNVTNNIMTGWAVSPLDDTLNTATINWSGNKKPDGTVVNK